MLQIANVSIGDPAHDPRARRVAAAGAATGHDVVSVCLGGRRAASRAPASMRELRGVGRIARWFKTTTSLARRARGLDPDVVHAHDLETLPAAWVLAHRRNARLVYDAHELYTGFERQPPRLWLAVASRIEGALARRADAVLTVSDEIAAALLDRHRLPRRPGVLLNCPPLEAVVETTHDRPLRAIYQAAAGPGRSLQDLPEVPGVEMHARVLGESSAPAHVELHDPVAPSELIAELVLFDVGLVIDRPETENARLALPNKLFEYMMAGLAVAVPDAPAMAELVRREGIGVVYPPGGLAEALAGLARDRPTLEGMRRRARAAAVERYNAEAQRPVLYEAWGL